MGLQYIYFTAKDDEAARAFLVVDPWPPPTYPNEAIPLDLLDDFESLLTGRPVEQIRAHPSFNADIVTQIGEHSGVAECGIVSVTDTLTSAVADVDVSALPSTYEIFADPLRELAVVARHATAHGLRMYCFWWV
jgi:hypothetical protein